MNEKECGDHFLTNSDIHLVGSPAFQNMSSKNVKIEASGTAGIRFMADALTSKVHFENVSVERSTTEALDDEAMTVPIPDKVPGNVGW